MTTVAPASSPTAATSCRTTSSIQTGPASRVLTRATQFTNNLVYANSTLGIGIHGGSGDLLVNNTIDQPQGDAVDLDGGSTGVQMRNNILWTLAGDDISVSIDSQQGFASDYNDLYVTNQGNVGLWQGAARATFAAWQDADFTDQNSLSQDPLFVNPAGADGVLGYTDPLHDGSDDDFHEQSLAGSFHGGSLAPVLNATTGLPAFPKAVLTADAAQSPAIDRGSASDAYSSEPVPSGGYINLGTYGNTAQASESLPQYVQVLRPSGGQVWPIGATFPILWRSQDTVGQVKIDLLQQGNPTPILTIAAGVPNSGSYSWTIPSTLVPASNYLVRVTRKDTVWRLGHERLAHLHRPAGQHLLRERRHGQPERRLDHGPGQRRQRRPQPCLTQGIDLRHPRHVSSRLRRHHQGRRRHLQFEQQHRDPPGRFRRHHRRLQRPRSPRPPGCDQPRGSEPGQ